MFRHNRLIQIENYAPFIGAEAVERIRQKAKPLQGLHVAHVNSTYYGGGVATLLDSLTSLMSSVGIKTGWRTIQGAPDFFSITKKMHNALQGGDFNLTEMKMEIYEDVVYKNAVRNHLEGHDFVIIHDPQPLPMITHYERRGTWIWRCHIDLSNANKELWSYLSPFIEKYDAVILSIEEYRQNLKTPQLFFLPAIDPFSITNKELTDDEVRERLDHHGIRSDLPLVVQLSRFDRWKDPEGVIKAYNLASREVDCSLVLLGNVATDDPEGQQVYQSLLSSQGERTRILSHEDTALVNALQRRAAVVLQKSLREGFGLTVAEAMWKGKPIIGGNVGGIRHQIEDEVNGFLVSSVEEAAARIVQLTKDEELRRQMGERARETVKERFLLTRLLEQYLDLFNSFGTIHRLRDRLQK
jgi:trehalose synthase